MVEQADHGSLFNRYEWLEAVETAFDQDPKHIVVEKDGNPVGVLPNFVRELPLPDSVTERLPVKFPLKMATTTHPLYGGPVLVSEKDDTLDLLFDGLEAVTGPEVIAHRITSHDLTYVRYGQYLHDRGYQPQFDKCLFFLDLEPDWEEIRADMDKERRRDLRRAHEQDYRIEKHALGEELAATYDAYAQNLDRVGGTLFPYEFLEALAENVGDRVLVFTAIVDGEEVGRYLHLLDEEAGILHHWLSAIPDRENYQYHPSELLHEHAIKFGIEEGYDEYGFGPTGSHYSDNVFQFKQKYGGRAVPMFRMETGFNPVLWSLYRRGRQRFRGPKE
ncbi:GNAT family N-acetyltransferase [Halobacterium wangiae]|uniref:GNAT family N-acetyltransferase n=1 Tax=Halobacterium wangiae TaxID=2902623 RepID=UPI001E5F6887|nr:GNAT family N-acetyltransferase [Halobacterium wangiae]